MHLSTFDRLSGELTIPCGSFFSNSYKRFTGVVYGLADPREEDPLSSIRYVGSTKDNPTKRRSQLKYESLRLTLKRPVHQWIRELDAEGLEPTVITLFSCDCEILRSSEEQAISDHGCQLLNKHHRCKQPLYFSTEAKAKLRGENHPQALLTEEEVQSIRHKYANGLASEQELSQFHGITSSEVSSIVHNHRWHNDNYTYSETLPAMERAYHCASGDLIRLIYHCKIATQTELAQVFGCDQGRISNIVRGRLWKNSKANPEASPANIVNAFGQARGRLIRKLSASGKLSRNKIAEQFGLKLHQLDLILAGIDDTSALGGIHLSPMSKLAEVAHA